MLQGTTVSKQTDVDNALQFDIMEEFYKELICEKRGTKMTENTHAEKVHRLTQSRKAKLGHLTSQAYEIERLMEDDANVNNVEQREELRLDFQDSLEEWCKTNDALTSLLSKEERENDQSSWFEPKLTHNRGFMHYVDTWIKAADDRAKQAEVCDADIQPADSVLLASAAESSRNRWGGSAAGSKVSTASSA